MRSGDPTAARIDRRSMMAGALAWPVGASRATAAAAQGVVPIGDMHYHAFIGRDETVPRGGPVGPALASGTATLVSWSVVGDMLWTERGPRGIVQKSEPPAGEPLRFLERQVARIRAHMASHGLRLVTRRADVEAAENGIPHIVLSVEGATFIENDFGRVQRAYDLGIRHIQLVHYIRNAIGDFQTVAPEHGGLTPLGRQVIEECNRLGILVDLAHCSPTTVSQALAVTRAPPVWSHSSVAAGGEPSHLQPAWRARQLSLSGARAIAAKGGVIGLWAFRPDVASTEGYAQRLAAMADQLGEDHVAFGTDINGLYDRAVMASHADARRVVEMWQASGMPQARLRKLAIGNYARVLKQVLKE